MSRLCSKLVEHTVVRLTLDSALSLDHVRWLRGAHGRQLERTEFHHHSGKGLVYHHPLVRYDARGREAIIAGLAEGAFLLRGIPPVETLQLGARQYRVLQRSLEVNRLALGPSTEPVIYSFQTPYLALNQENYLTWHRSDPFARRRLLQKIVVGNLLSLAKAVDLHVDSRLHAEVDLRPDIWQELKPGLRLLGFRGAVQVNFMLPDRWGIGKSSARGFGTLIREEATHGQGESEG